MFGRQENVPMPLRHTQYEVEIFVRTVRAGIERLNMILPATGACFCAHLTFCTIAAAERQRTGALQDASRFPDTSELRVSVVECGCPLPLSRNKNRDAHPVLAGCY
jgi:hypothetical protein